MRTRVAVAAMLGCLLCSPVFAVLPSDITITSTSLPDGVVGQPYSATLSADGPHGPFTWTVTGGLLPAGLSLSSSGQITGLPTLAGTFRFTAAATNTDGQRASALISLTIASAIVIQPTSLPDGQVGVSYSQAFHASGGTAPYSWAIASGAVPAGLSLSSTGALSGTPTAAGTSSFTVKATDSHSASSTQALSLVIAGDPFAITTTSLPNGQVGAAYSQALQASGGTTPYTWSLAGGALPAGLSLSASGQISGTPTAAGNANFTAKAVDSSGSSATKALSINITAAPLTITTTSLASGQVGVAYSQTLQASGGTSPYTWSLASGALPAGLSLSASGQISGTPTAAGNANFTAKVVDSTSTSTTKALSINIAPVPLSITTTSLTSGQVGAAYSQTLQASGGTSPYTWSLAGGALPAGLSLSASGEISGTPTTAGNANFTTKVADSSGASTTKALSINIAPPTLSITTTSLASGQVGAAYSQSVQASGGTPPYSWSVAGGALPAGLSLSASGQISGTPAASGTASFTLRVADSAGGSASQNVSISIGAALAITTCPAGSTLVGQAYSSSVSASGGSPPYAWSTSGSLPPGITLDRGSGTLSGIPTQAGPFSFGIVVTDSVSATATKSCAISVTASLAITTGALAQGATSTAYAQQLTASGGTPPYSWSLSSGGLPGGLTLSPSGAIGGYPNVAGTFTFTVRATDSAGVFAERSLAIIITSLLTVGCPASTAINGQPYSSYASVVGGQAPYTWSSNGALPAGLGLSAIGQLSGTPNYSGTFPYSLTVTDKNGASATQQCTLTVGVSLAILNASLPDGSVSVPYSQTLSASGGKPPYAWSVVAGSLPPGLTLSPAGLISGSPSQAVLASFNIQVTDANGNSTQTSFSIHVMAGLIVAACPPQASEIGLGYQSSLAAAGGTKPYTWSVSSGSLPAGLTVDPSSGILSGAPSQAGSAQFVLMVGDANSQTATRQCSINVSPALAITTTSLAAGVPAATYSDTVTASGGQPPYTWSTTTGALPPGLSLAAARGQITGTPTSAGTFAFTIQVLDSLGGKSTKDLSLNIALALAIPACPTVAATLGQPYSAPLTAAGGTSPYQWSIGSGSLAPGLSLDSTNSLITGIPTQPGSASFVLQVGDANGKTATRACTIQVESSALAIISSATLPHGVVSQSYSQTLAASGGRPPYTWSMSAAGAPPGFSLDPSSGTLSGTASTPGTFTFTIQVTDQDSNTALQAFVLTIVPSNAPNVTIVGLSDVVDAALQPAFSLQLDSAYPAQISGTITLTFVPDPAVGVDDPAVQFATGGRTLNFSVAANSNTAVFTSPVVALQTGTVAGTIQLTISLQAAGTDITPTTQPIRVIHINRSAPNIVSVNVTQTSNGLEVHLVGFATTREVTQGVFRFQPANGGQAIEVDVPMTGSGTAWFQSGQSMQFGGQFSLIQPFTLQGQSFSSFSSLSVMLSNSQGNSASKIVQF